MPKQNANKVISCNARGITIYNQGKKHHWVSYPAQEPSMLAELQLNGNLYKGKRYQRPVFNAVQNHLLNEALYGLSQFREEELKAMPLPEKARIADVHARAQQVILQMKRTVFNSLVDNVMGELFPDSGITKLFKETSEQEGKGGYPAYTLRELGITKEQVADRLVAEGILPALYFRKAA